MSKNKVHLAVNVLAYLVMVCLASTGLILIYRLPHGSPRDGLTLLSLDRHGWGDAHWYLAIGLMVLVATHVVLHWKWVTNTLGALVRSHAMRRAGAGLGGTLLLLGLGLATAGGVAAPWLVGVERGQARSYGSGHRGGRGAGRTRGQSHEHNGDPAQEAAAPTTSQDCGGKDGGGGHGGHGDDCDETIRGRTTLAEAAQEARVPVARLIAELKLPGGTRPESRLGHLRQEHGFDMEQVRSTVARLGRDSMGAE